MKIEKIVTLILAILLVVGSLSLASISMVDKDMASKDHKIDNSEDPTSLANSPWPKFMGNEKNTGLSPYNTTYVDGTILWTHSTGINGTVGRPSVGADGTVYVGTGKDLSAINPDGTRKWNFSGESNGWTGPALSADGTIYSANSYSLYAINSDGTEQWNFTTGFSIDYSSPTIDQNGTIYVGSRDKYLYAINPDGSERWSFTTGDWIFSSPAIANDGTVYIGSEDHNLYAINPNGTEKWQFNTWGKVRSSASIGSDGTIYVGSVNSGRLYAINPDGTEKWRFNTQDEVHSSPAIGADGTIYIGSYDKKLYAINPNGSERWSFDLDYVVGFTSPAIGADGTIYIGTGYWYIDGGNGKFYAINPDGTEQWSHTSGPGYNNYYSSPAIGSDGTVYVGYTDNTLYAFGGPSSITLTRPTGGEVWSAGTNENITWTTSKGSGEITGIDLEYSTDGGASWSTIVTGIADNGSYMWNVPFVNTKTAVIRATVYDDLGLSNTNDSGTFEIATVPPSITLTRPLGGETWDAGTTENITWNTTKGYGNIIGVDLEYSTDEGASWNIIVTGTADDGSYAWTLPLVSTTTARIRATVHDDIGAVNSDTSGNFEIVYVYPPSITLTLPLGGETWFIDSNENITWDTLEGDGNITGIDLFYSTDAGVSWNIIVTGIADTGSYSWIIPEEPTTEARIRVTVHDDNDLNSTDTCANFIIRYMESPSIILTRPTGGETWYIGYDEEITWQTTEGDGNITGIDLEYSTDGGSSWTTIIEGTANTGSYTWTVPDEPTIEAKIRVTVHDDNYLNATDTCENFIIKYMESPSITLTRPTGGETWYIGDNEEITWVTTDGDGNITGIDLEYSIDGGSSWTNIVTGTANDGSYIWLVPSETTTEARIKATVHDDNGLSASNISGNFVIDQKVPPSVTLTRPTGGEIWYAGTDENITWTTNKGTGNITSVKLEYSTDGGISCVQIASDLEDTGTYTWTIPLVSTAEAVIRIFVYDDMSFFAGDHSNNFEIIAEPPVIALTRPTGGEIWNAGVNEDILWNTTKRDGNIVGVDLEYSTDEGISWTTMITGTPDTGSYTWTVPNESTVRARIRATVHDDIGISSHNTSGNFEIVYTKPSITLTRPIGGETWYSNNDESITWETVEGDGNISSVDLEYSIDGGLSWTTMISGTPDTGSYTWTVPNEQTTEARIRATVHDDNGFSNSDTSGIFEIAKLGIPISSWTELNATRNSVDEDYYLTRSLLTTDDDYLDFNDPGTEGWQPIIGESSTPFTGKFDGNGYDIFGLYINRSSTNYVGLFGYVGTAGGVRSIGVVDVDVSGSMAVGGLVGYSEGTVENSYATGTVSGFYYVGGLLGYNSGTVSKSSATGTVSGDGYSGGLVGYNPGTVSKSYATGNVICDGYSGGLVGYNGGTVSKSYATGNVSGNERIGGLVGNNNWGSTVEKSYATGTVTRKSGSTNTDLGGFVGYNSDGKIINCYSTGSAHYEDAADPTDKGFAGTVVIDVDYEMTGNFWDVEISGQTGTAGNATGKTTAEMMGITTFSSAGWNIVGVADANTRNTDYIWNIVDAGTYPFFSWQPYSSLDICSIELYVNPESDGWNFVSFNIELADTSITSILDGIAYDKVMYYDASVGKWQSYVPGRAEHFNNLQTWDHSMGVWICVAESGTLTVEGSTPTSTDITLYPGWNMVGLPSSTAGNHGLPTEVTKIGHFNATAEYNMDYDYNPAEFTFEPGQGYWIYNDAEYSATWTVDY